MMLRNIFESVGADPSFNLSGDVVQRGVEVDLAPDMWNLFNNSLI